MNKLHILDKILTEFDETISSELNVDPLGLLVIWSSYGQDIFRRRISSISNDVRNFTLNLFNHSVIRSLINDDGVVLGNGLRNKPDFGTRGKDSAAFKQACLIYLENVFTYLMIDAQDKEGVETRGVLGISKARKLWSDTNRNPKIIFSNQSNAHILVRQNSLGVSGRYKTPFVELKFFDGNYDYTLPFSVNQWQIVQKDLLGKSKPLANLHALVCAHMAELLATDQTLPATSFIDLSNDLKHEFTNAFSSPVFVGAYSRNFWLAVTQLNQGASGALYDVLNQEWVSTNQRQVKKTANVFADAVNVINLSEEERTKLKYVLLLEPFLAEIDLLLSVMLSAKSQSLSDASAKWTELGRSTSTLRDLSLPIQKNNIQAQVSGIASLRLNELLQLGQMDNIMQQMTSVLHYHEKVMSARGQSPWLRLVENSRLKVDVRITKLPTRNERPVGTWVHQYYIPQFRNLLSGLRGNV